MDPGHRLIIVNEIEKWRENNLLSAQYCDFLLALYTEGKNPSHIVKKSTTRNRKIQYTLIKELKKWKENQLIPAQYCDYLLSFYMSDKQDTKQTLQKTRFKKEYLYFLLVVPLALIFFYFTKLTPTMQIGLVVFFVFLGFGITYYYFKKDGWFQIPLALSAFVILIFSVQWITGIYPENIDALYYTILANCGIWLAFGLVFRMISLIVSGILGAVFVMFFMF